LAYSNPDYSHRLLGSPDGFFGLKVADYQSGYVVCKKAHEEMGDDGLATTPIGTGPFQFGRVKSGEYTLLERFSDYWGGVPKIAQLQFFLVPEESSRVMGLLADQYDVCAHIYENEIQSKLMSLGYQAAIGLPAGNWIHFNLTKEPLDDIRVRQALAYGISREGLLQFYGPKLAKPMYAPIPSAYIGGLTGEDVPEELQYNHDPDKARGLLTDAGYPDGFSFSTICTEANWALSPLQVIQNQWREIGVEMEIKVIEHTTWHVEIRANNAYVVPYNATRLPYPGAILTQFYYGPSSSLAEHTISNFSNYYGADEFIEEGIKASTMEEALDAWSKAQLQILEDLPAFPFVEQSVRAFIAPHVQLAYEPSTVLEYFPNFTVDSYVTGK